MYRQHRLDPERFSSMFGGVAYDLVYNKYYVDEIYNALVIQPYLALCFAFAWFDLHIIDGVVNLAATIAVIALDAVGALRYLRRRRAGEFRVE